MFNTIRVASLARSALALAAALLISGVFLLLGASPAAAHDNVLTGSEPPASSTVSTPPDRVVLNFKWRVQPGSATVTVVGPDGRTQWQQGEIGAVDRSIGVDLRQLGPAGRYEVRYSGMTGWGYPFRGAVVFTLVSMPAPVPGGGADSGLPLSWIVSVLLLTVAGTVVGVRLSGRMP